MAIKEIKREWSPCQLDYVKTFLLHSEKELKDLPKCCIGSKAIVSETDNEYFCTESGWKLGSELGGGSSPSEVVILPETEFPGGEMGTQIPITTPLSAMPTPGATAIVTWNGMEYECSIALQTESGNAGYCMGNFEALDAPYGGSNPDAPFVVILVPAGMGGMYGIIMPVEEVASITLSIVQVGAASGGGSASAGSGVTIFHASCDFDPNTRLFSNGAGKESFAELKSAYDNDGLLWCRLTMNISMEGAPPATVECPLTGVEGDSIITFQPLGHMLEMGLMITIDSSNTVNVFID